MRTFLHILTNTLYYGFVAVLLLVAGSMYLLNTNAIGGIQIKIVRSGSMEPAIPVGSLVIIRPAPVYTVGDVITFGPDTKTKIPTTHRIVEVVKENGTTRYVTKGDANEHADRSTVATKDIIGRVDYSMPYAGYVLDFARQPLGFLLLIVLPAAVVILDELWKIVRELAVFKRRRTSARASDGRPHFTSPSSKGVVGTTVASPLSARAHASSRVSLRASVTTHVAVVPPRAHARAASAPSFDGVYSHARPSRRYRPDSFAMDGIIPLEYARR